MINRISCLAKLRGLGLGLALTMTASVAFSQSEITLQAPAAPEKVRDALSASSLLIAAEAEGKTDVQDLLAAARADYARLIGTLYDAGYYSATIRIAADGREVANISPLRSPSQVTAFTIRVDPGPQFRFGAAEVRPQAPLTELPEGFRTGQVAASGLMRDAVATAVTRWRETGHAKAEAAGQQITANHRVNTVDARFTINPGPVVRFGDLSVTGNSAVRAERIRAIAGLPTGQVFDPDDVDAAARRLRDTGAFRSAAVREAETLGPGDTLPINAEVVEAKPRRIGGGAELSSTEGLSLSAYWLHRNLRGGAERLRFDAGIAGIGGGTGGVDYSLSGRYTIPALWRPDMDVFGFAEIERLDEPNFVSNTASIGFGFERRYSDHRSAEASLGLLFSDVTDDFGSREFFLLTAPASYTFDYRDDALNPTGGFFVETELTPFLGLNDSASGVRAFVDGRAYRGFGPDNRFVLAGRLQLGSVAGSSLQGTLPEYLFYSGGGGTVRGQDFQSLGIELGNGDVVGGRSFLGASAELRANITDTIGVVGFFDTGYVSADSLPGQNGEGHSGAGIGLRYNTGIGPIRLDVGAPIGGTSEGVQIYVGIGQAF